MSVIKKPDLKIFAQDAKTGEIETFPDVLRGWGVTLERTAGKPPLEWFNAIGKRVDEWLMYLTQRGLAEWDSTVDYPKDALVQHSSVFYVALKVTKGEQPNTSQNAWKPLVDFLGVNNKLDKTAVVQSTGTSTTSVMSQKASTDAFQMKGDYADKSTSTPQSFNAAILSNKDILSVSGSVKIGLKAGEKDATLILDAGNGWKNIKLQDRAGTLALVGDSYLKSESDFQLNEIKNNVYPKSATDNFLNKKVDKENISQQLANDVNKVPSLDLVTRELGKKQASGNYADKSSSETQSFSSPIIALKEVMSRNGNISLGIKTEGKPAVVFNFGTIWRTLSFQDKGGTIALSGDSYTKAESNKQLDDIKNNVYSKSASDGKYGLKNTISKLDNGWWKCGDTGLIYQYGIVSGCVSSDESRSFPIPFPNKCLSMVGGYLNENEWGQGISMRVIDNKTFFSVVRSASGAWAAVRAYYIAIGY
ncbi:hypothetical protein BBX45_11120 [Proteus mirabilis]|uniref:gp53-like domain-containing protein n=1 Tax=Proteus mirabilis TaxID=584 RepID=UPI0008DDC810|nr:hypothetical protein [Proteus mirabilis]OHY48212.1 hypothetical protein BBX45_11120 [Proteus mirabilis]